ncbi:MAG TPA: dihydrolipoamide acetyltransferase family protein [Gammaproteobacteria bacterium]|nr:dihydrolipoamide acetyltransferase family protein [Gammaproteobacteria bacterium]
MNIFHLPDLGEGLAEAEIREWYVKEGDIVKVDQPLLSVETAKAVVDVPSPYAGRIMKLHGKVHEVIKTEAPLVEFESTTKASEKKDKGSIVGKLEENALPLHEELIIGTQAALAAPALKISPTLRALAKQLRVDLNSIRPTGPKGQITIEDIKKQARISQPSHVTSQALLREGEALHGVRRAMAVAMTLAHQEVAQVTIIDDADIGHLPKDVDLTVLILEALITAIQVEPALNAWFDGKNLQRQLLKEVNIGLAMDTPEGLFVPVLKKANHHSFQDLRDKINQFKEGVRLRTIAAADMQEATITLSNFGTLAGKYASPLVVPPTVAILGCGRTYEAVVVREGKMIMTRLLPLSLSTDHRAVTGGEAARFLAAVIEHIRKAK